MTGRRRGARDAAGCQHSAGVRRGTCVERVQAVGLGSLDDAVALRGGRGPWARRGNVA